MRLVLDSDPRIHLVRSYGGGEIVIADQHITRPLIITPQRLVLDWNATSFPELTEAQLQALFDLGAGIVLLGAGERQMFASPAVRASFRAHQIALECMTLGAACRTYNILASEERPVAAGLFPYKRLRCAGDTPKEDTGREDPCNPKLSEADKLE